MKQKNIYIIIIQKESGNTFTLLIISIDFKMNKIAHIYYYDPQSAGMNVQSSQSDSTPRRLTLDISLMLLQRNKPLRFIST